MTREVPVARVIGAGLVQALDTLINQLDRCLHALGAEHLHNLVVDLLDGKRGIDGTNVINRGER